MGSEMCIRDRSCQVINLVENHRQAEDKAYADLLNQVRLGEISDSNLLKLKERVREIDDPDIPENALYCVSLNAEVNQINEVKMEFLDGEIVESHARHYCSTLRNYRPRIDPRLGWVANTRYLNLLKMKVGARIMLIFNINKPCLLYTSPSPRDS